VTHPLDVWCGVGLGSRNDDHRVDRRSLIREISTVSIKIINDSLMRQFRGKIKKRSLFYGKSHLNIQNIMNRKRSGR
jgi:hypothetical protein